MDLEQFYAADPRRRHSEELEFGRDWTEGRVRCEVSWVAATGELYAMREPLALFSEDIFGDMRPGPLPAVELLGVEVLGVVAGRDAIEAVMSGWESAMGEPDSLGWVRARLRNASTEMGDPPAQPSEDLPGY